MAIRDSGSVQDLEDLTPPPPACGTGCQNAAAADVLPARVVEQAQGWSRWRSAARAGPNCRADRRRLPARHSDPGCSRPAPSAPRASPPGLIGEPGPLFLVVPRQHHRNTLFLCSLIAPLPDASRSGSRDLRQRCQPLPPAAAPVPQRRERVDWRRSLFGAGLSGAADELLPEQVVERAVERRPQLHAPVAQRLHMLHDPVAVARSNQRR